LSAAQSNDGGQAMKMTTLFASAISLLFLAGCAMPEKNGMMDTGTMEEEERMEKDGKKMMMDDTRMMDDKTREMMRE
jgi:aspartate-semialdehyde dehydrogenase